MSGKPARGAGAAAWVLKKLDVLLNILSVTLRDPSLPFPAASKEALEARMTALRDALRKQEARLRAKK